MPTYSRFNDAAQGLRGMGSHANEIAIKVAQQRIIQQHYQEQEAARQLQMQLAAQAAQQRMNQQYMIAQDRARAGQPLLDARTGQANEAAGKIGDLRGAAEQAGTSYSDNMQQPSPLFLGEGPSRNAENMLVQQDRKRALMKALVQAQTLLGQPQRAMDFQTRDMANEAVGPNMDPKLAAAILTGTKSAIPVPHQGGIYDTVQGQMGSEMPQNVPPGNALVDPASPASPMYLNPNKPVKANNELGSLQMTLGRFMQDGYVSPHNAKDPIYQATTNRLGQILQQSLQGGQAAPVAQPPVRKLGDTVTTPKGTFKWNGGGWDPVQLPAE